MGRGRLPVPAPDLHSRLTARAGPWPPGRTDVALVLFGGFFGAAVRQLVEQAIAVPADGFPWGTLAVNLSGAFALGLLIATLARQGAGRRVHQLRLLVGTGFLGAFTTYSTLAVETDLLVRGNRAGTAALYLAVSVIGGLACAAGGIALAGQGMAVAKLSALPTDPDLDDDATGSG